MSALEIIRESISKEGCISFARFMELALYHPQHGYYEDCRIGREGDFFTSVSAGGLFGELLATQFLDWARERPAPGPEDRWVLLEAGAHDGRLALDILWHLNRQNALDGVEYWILEPSENRKGLQQKTLSAFQNSVRWFNGWESLPPEGVTGVIFSNELLDSFVVHRLGWDAKAGQWFEWGVGIEGADCRWIRCPDSERRAMELVRSYLRYSGLIEWNASDEESNRGMRAFFSILPDGFILEVSPTIWQWWELASETLNSGYLMTFDYGFQVEELISPLRTSGTLRAYHKHHACEDLLARPGEQDLTASINFTMLQAIASKAGLSMTLHGTQNLFLSQIVARALKNDTEQKAWESHRLRQFHTLTHPDHLGEALKVILFKR